MALTTAPLRDRTGKEHVKPIFSEVQTHQYLPSDRLVVLCLYEVQNI